MKIGDGIEQLFFSTVRIETMLADGSGSGVGTGFFFAYEPENLKGSGQYFTFLVTNKHVIDDAAEAKLVMTKCDADGNPDIANRQDLEVKNMSPGWFGHPTADVDVAVMPWDTGKIREVFDPFWISIPSASVPSQEAMEDLDAIEEVTFIGYPNGMYDSVNLMPVARRGTTATPPMLDYEGKPAFLIDASVFPGSSGSPVFIAGPSVRVRDGAPRFVNRSVFLGVVSAVFTADAFGEIEVVPIPTRVDVRVRTKQMIDIGYVFKSSAVVETVEIVLRDLGKI